MHTHVYLDEEDRILRPAITWMDQRSASLVEELNGDSTTAGRIFAKTKNRLTPTYSAPNLLWIQRYEPDVWQRTRRVLVAKDYLKYLLTGSVQTDYSDASGMLLFDVAQHEWSAEILSIFGVSAQMLPPVGASHEITGTVTAEASAALGLPKGIPVANGSADNAAAALGAGMLDAGQGTLIIGTAGVVSVCSDRPLPDPSHRVVCWKYCLPDRWINLGVMQTAGGSLQWFRSAFDGDKPESSDVFEQYNREAQSVPDGSGGMVFLPYLNGERTPYWDSNARGVFFGANLATSKPHFVKAVMEGVSFALRNNIETVEALGIQVNEVRAIGGGLRSEAWLSILARVLGRPIHTVTASDPGNLGNVLIAGKAAGLYDSVEGAVRSTVRTERTVEEETPPVYADQYRLFLSLYEDLKDRFRETAELGTDRT
jgi:xylulokinase